MSDLKDVNIRLYHASRDDHGTAVVAFRNESEELIKKFNCPKVDVEIKDDKMYFIPGDKGYKLTLDRLQLWRLSDQIKDWIGSYPLKFDSTRNCYYISKLDQTSSDVVELPSRLGMTYSRKACNENDKGVKITNMNIVTKSIDNPLTHRNVYNSEYARKATDNEKEYKVGIKYYESTNSGSIMFFNACEKVLHARKVDIQFDNGRMYFTRMDDDIKDGYRIKMERHKINILPSRIDPFKEWVGIAVLHNDLHKGWYIAKSELQPHPVKEVTIADEVDLEDVVEYLKQAAIKSLTNEDVEHAQLFAKAAEALKEV